MRTTTPPATMGAFLNLITGLAAVRDLAVTGTAHGTTWFLVDLAVIAIAAAGTAGTAALIYRSERNIKTGFARHRATPEVRDLEH